MDIDLNRLGHDQLNLLLNKAECKLQAALLEGVSWKELKDIRDDITEIRIAMHRAIYPHDTSEFGQIRMRLWQGPELGNFPDAG